MHVTDHVAFHRVLDLRARLWLSCHAVMEFRNLYLNPFFVFGVVLVLLGAGKLDRRKRFKWRITARWWTPGRRQAWKTATGVFGS